MQIRFSRAGRVPPGLPRGALREAFVVDREAREGRRACA
jgi:hypothetical protein